jgi:basic membrane protein A
VKKFFVPLIVVAAVAAIFLAGCMPAAPEVTPPVTPPPVTPPPVTPPPVTPPPVTPPPTAYKVAIITAGSRTDGAWSEDHYLSYLALKDEFPEVEFTFTDLVEYPDYVAVVSAASEANNLICIDSSFYETIVALPPQYPDTWYAYWCPTEVEYENEFNFPNFVGYEQKDEDSGFLVGVVAGMMTKTNKVAYVAGQAYPEIIRYGYGIKAGLEYINPDAELMVLYTGSWVDIEKAYESAKAMIELDADVIAHYSDAGGSGVAKAVKEADNVWFVGEVVPEAQTALAPDRILTTFIVNHQRFMEHAVQTLLDGTIHRDFYSFGIKPGTRPIEQEGLPVIAPLTNVPDEVKAKVAEVEDLIRTGQLVVPLKVLEEDLRPLY